MDFFRTNDLSVGYNGVPLIEHIALHVRRGEWVTLIGPNGCGKSTILKSLVGQLRLLGGTVYLDGRDMASMSRAETAARLSVLMTERTRPELMTCAEVAAAGRYPYTGRLGVLSAEDWEKVQQALRLVHAEELAERDFSCISDGQRQRILLARALCQEPEILVLDEPTSFLDIRHKLELLSILKDLVRQKNLTVVMSLHELDLAQKVSDLIVCVREGAVDRCSTPEEIFTSDYMMQLYGVERGSYNAAFGCLELEAVRGTPEVFVIGGGGSGLTVYRKLQRQGIPFAAGVLHENDLDFPTAKSLASEVIAEHAFEPISDAAFERALACMDSCTKVICCTPSFGTMNARNRMLAERARQMKKLEHHGESSNDKM